MQGFEARNSANMLVLLGDNDYTQSAASFRANWRASFGWARRTGLRVAGVLGNHDWWKDGPKVRRALESAGVVVLDNHAQAVTLGQCRLWLVGVGDLWEGHPDIPLAFAAVNDDAPVIAITHNPDLFPQMPARASLVVAGHTHGGQVWLLPGRPSKRGLHYLAGKFDQDGRHLFVTPGIGTSIMPFRFRVPPEISRLTLHAARQASP